MKGRCIFLTKSGTFLGVHVSFREHIGLRTLGTSRFFEEFFERFQVCDIISGKFQPPSMPQMEPPWQGGPKHPWMKPPQSPIYIRPFIGG